MAYFGNQGRGRNLVIAIDSDRGGPYGIMKIYVPVILYFVYEPSDRSAQTPSFEGEPPWTESLMTSFRDRFVQQARNAWRRKFPIYGYKDRNRSESANARTIGFAPYATVKIDVEVEIQIVEQEDAEQCRGGFCIQGQNLNLLFILRQPAGHKRYRSNCSSETRAGMMYEDDVEPKTLHGFRQITAAHEVGHVIGFEHIGNNEPGCQYDPTGRVLLMANRGNADACYMERGTWSDNIMGVGMIVSSSQYDVFGGLLGRIMPDYDWRVERYSASIPLGNPPQRPAGGCGFRP